MVLDVAQRTHSGRGPVNTRLLDKSLKDNRCTRPIPFGRSPWWEIRA